VWVICTRDPMRRVDTATAPDRAARLCQIDGSGQTRHRRHGAVAPPL